MTTNFDLRVRTGEGSARYVLEVLASPEGESAEVIQSAPTIPDDIMAAWQASELTNSQARQLGALLHQFLFPAPIMERLVASRATLSANQERLRLRLRIEPVELSRLPWELCWSEQEDFLAMRTDLAWVRYIREAFAADPLGLPTPLKLIVALASPNTLPQLDTAAESAIILDSLQAVTDKVKTKILPNTTWNHLRNALSEGADVVHFVGHGGINADGEGYLALEDETGGLNEVTAADLRILFSGRKVRLVVLNACQSAIATGQPALMGVAPSLVRSEIPAVIALQAPIPDTVARSFTKTLYEEMIKGTPLDTIVTEMRVDAYGATRPYARWGIPVLFMRAPDGKLWVTDADREEAETSGRGGVTFKNIEGSQINIGGSVVGGDYIQN